MQLDDLIREKEKHNKMEKNLQKEKNQQKQDMLQQKSIEDQNRIKNSAKQAYEKICKDIAEKIQRRHSISDISCISTPDDVAQECITHSKHMKGNGYSSPFDYPTAKKIVTKEYWDLFQRELSRLLQENNVQHEFIAAVIKYNKKKKKNEIVKTIALNETYSFGLYQHLHHLTITCNDPFRLCVAVKYTYTKKFI